MDTLVLSRDHTPIRRISWQRAMCLIVQEKVEVIAIYADRLIRSAYETFNVPSVVRYFFNVTRHMRDVRFSRQNVYARDHGTCQYCSVRVSQSEATYDHVVPRSHGGTTHWNNICIACVGCNQRKGGRTPAQAGMKLRTKPIKPKSLPRFMGLSMGSDMPRSWREFLIGYGYWAGELDSE